jgi:hypothetical protein
MSPNMWNQAPKAYLKREGGNNKATTNDVTRYSQPNKNTHLKPQLQSSMTGRKAAGVACSDDSLVICPQGCVT